MLKRQTGLFLQRKLNGMQFSIFGKVAFKMSSITSHTLPQSLPPPHLTPGFRRKRMQAGNKTSRVATDFAVTSA